MFGENPLRVRTALLNLAPPPPPPPVNVTGLFRGVNNIYNQVVRALRL